MLIRELLFATSVCALFAACSDGTDPMTTIPECGGHGQSECDDGFKMREGGEIRLELRRLPNGRDSRVVAQAWFIDAQTPGKLPGVAFNQCADLNQYLSAASPVQATFDSRNWYDVGDNIRLEGGGKTIDLAKTADATDFRNQVHKTIYVKDGKAQGTVDPTFLLPRTGYQAKLANGESPGEPIYIPSEWTTTLSGPRFDGTVFSVSRGQDVTWQFQSEDDSTVAPIAFFIFAAKDASTKWACFLPNTGSITVPAAIVDQIAVEGSILAGTIRHKVVNFNDRNLDLVGVNCRIQAFKVQ